MRYLLVMALSLCAFAQEIPKKTFSPSQCKTDERWLNSEADSNFKDLPLDSLRFASQEMNRCEIDYPEDLDSHLWVSVDRLIWIQIAQRHKDFLVRHNLFDKFVEEDKNGER